MRFKQFKSQDEVRNTLYLALTNNKIRKTNLAMELSVSYPTILSKLERPFSFSVSELLSVCEFVDLDINDLLIKY
jgi:DNA-binding Xre family transcriptional regulator